MGTGYTRNDTSNNIADGNIIDAADLDGEFDALQAAFNSSTGHTHDGTSAEGAPITVTGPAQEYVSTGTEFRPKTNNTYDLGSLALQWKNLYVDGTAYLDAVDIDGGAIDGTAIGGSTAAAGNFTTLGASGNATVGGTLGVTGLATLASVDINAGNIDGTTIGSVSAAAGTFTTLGATTGNITTVNATTVDSTNLEITNIKAKDGTSAGSIANSTGVVTLASSVLTTTDINGGTIDGTTIATSDITVGTGKTLNVSSGTLTLANDQISGDKVEGGTINAITINTLGSTTGNITTVNSTTVDTTNLEVTNLKAKDGTSAGSIANSTGVVTLASSVLTTTDINGGTIDGVTIGGASAGAGTFTNLTATGTTTLAGASTTADITFGDNDKAIFGAGSDLEIYHSGTASYISEKGTGRLFITTDGDEIRLNTTGGSEFGLRVYQDGAVQLYHDNVAKLATTATGIDVTGTVTAETLVASEGDGFTDIRITDTSDAGVCRLLFGDSVSTIQGQVRYDNSDDSMAFRTDNTDRINISSGGDISFYEDTGTTPKFFWDASAERLGIGTSSPSYPLEIRADSGNANMRLITSGTGSSDSSIMRIQIAGTSADSVIYFGDGADSNAGVIRYDHSVDDLLFSANAAERLKLDSSGDLDLLTGQLLMAGNTTYQILGVEFDDDTTTRSTSTTSSTGSGMSSGESYTPTTSTSKLLVFWRARADVRRTTSSGNDARSDLVLRYYNGTSYVGDVTGFITRFGAVNTIGTGNNPQLFTYDTPVFTALLDQTQTRSDTGGWTVRLYGYNSYTNNLLTVGNNSWIFIEIDNGTA